MARRSNSAAPARWVCAAVALWLCAGCGRSAGSAAGSAAAPLHLEPTDRLLVLAPHPDDEVLGCGGLIQRAMAMGLPVRVVFLTYGDNNQWSFLVYRRYPVLMPEAVRQMGLVRHDEAMAADRLLGLPPERLTFLGYPDFGTLKMWKEHWNGRPPYRSMLTHVTEVPYANARRPGAPYTGEEVLRDLTEVLAEFRPTKIFVSHPADHMPDHAALYLFLRVALWNLEGTLTPAPECYPYLVHFRRWPKPRGYRPQEPLAPPGWFRGQVEWHAFALTPEEAQRKRQALEAHRTQYQVSERYLLSFVRPAELFGDFSIVALHRTTAPTPLDAGTSTPAAQEDSPEQLTDEERAVFIGMERRYVQRVGDDLVLTIEMSKPLARGVRASVLLFGYRPDRPFGQMPKLQVSFGEQGEVVTDQGRPVDAGTIQVRQGWKQLMVRLPLSALGSPTRILTSARTYLGELPLDWVAWRIIEVAEPHGELLQYRP